MPVPGITRMGVIRVAPSVCQPFGAPNPSFLNVAPWGALPILVGGQGVLMASSPVHIHWVLSFLLLPPLFSPVSMALGIQWLLGSGRASWHSGLRVQSLFEAGHGLNQQFHLGLDFGDLHRL